MPGSKGSKLIVYSTKMFHFPTKGQHTVVSDNAVVQSDGKHMREALSPSEVKDTLLEEEMAGMCSTAE